MKTDIKAYTNGLSVETVWHEFQELMGIKVEF